MAAHVGRVRRSFYRAYCCLGFSRTRNIRQIRNIWTIKTINGLPNEGNTSWYFLGSFFIGGLLGYQLHKINTISNVLYEVRALESNSDDSGSPPRSKRFNFIADAVETAAPAVVHIEVTDRRMAGNYLMGHAEPTSLGSGFIVSEDGIVLTNAHVVENALNVKVKLKDGQEFIGDVVDVDPAKDLAAIKLNAPQEIRFPTLMLGSSSSLRPGEWVIAMGSPLRLSNTVTAGIVSTVHRGGEELGLPNRNMEYIQTDAAINIGSSGGPLVNLDGEVIGISVITVRFAAGISFAIPIDAAKEFLNGVPDKKTSKKTGVIQRRLESPQRWYIGISMLTLTPPILEALQRRDVRFQGIKGGVFVAEVNFGSPAQKCGLKSGDVITKINANNICTSKEVYEYVRKGEVLNIELQRGSETVQVAIHPQMVG